MASFEEDYAEAKDICTVMKALDTNLFDNHKEIMTFHNEFETIYQCWNTRFSAVSKHTIGYKNSIDITGKLIDYRPHSDSFQYFNYEDMKGYLLKKHDSVFTPTEEQYFQNSILYDPINVRRFLIYGILNQETFENEFIHLDYNVLNRLVHLANEARNAT